MKKAVCWLLVLALAGCVSVKVPKYLPEKFPYKKKFYSDFETTLKATEQALQDTGWKISDRAHPSLFEEGYVAQDQSKQVLIFTEVRQTPLLLSSHYMSLNVFVRSADQGADVEIRYVSVVPVIFSNSQSYKNDPVVGKVLSRIAELVDKKAATP